MSAVTSMALAGLGLAAPASAALSRIVDTAPTTQAHAAASGGWWLEGAGATAAIDGSRQLEPVSGDGALTVSPAATGSTYLLHATYEGLALSDLVELSALVRESAPTDFGFAFDVTCRPVAGNASANRVRIQGTGLPSATGTGFTALEAQGKDGAAGPSGPVRLYVSQTSYVEPDGSTSLTGTGALGEWAPKTAHTYGEWASRCSGPISSYGFSWLGGGRTDLDLVGWNWEDLFDFGSNQAPHAGDQHVVRMAGSDRIDTAARLSASLWQAHSAKAAVVTTANGWADGLSGGVLAADAGGPLLLNPATSLDGRVRSELVRALAPRATVYLLGGTAALNAQVESDLRALVTTGSLKGQGVTVKRIVGATRFGTATKVADAVLGLPGAHPLQAIFVATGADFADALSASAAAAHIGGVLLLSGKDARGRGVMPSETAAWLKAHNPENSENWMPELAVGGSAAQALGYAPGEGPTFVGRDRYETSAIVGEVFFDYLGYNTGTVVLASGASPADGLSGGAAAGRLGVPVVLVPPTGAALPGPVAQFLKDRAQYVYSGLLLGGTKAVSTGVASAVLSLIAAR